MQRTCGNPVRKKISQSHKTAKLDHEKKEEMKRKPITVEPSLAPHPVVVYVFLHGLACGFLFSCDWLKLERQGRERCERWKPKVIVKSFQICPTDPRLKENREQGQHVFWYTTPSYFCFLIAARGGPSIDEQIALSAQSALKGKWWMLV